MSSLPIKETVYLRLLYRLVNIKEPKRIYLKFMEVRIMKKVNKIMCVVNPDSNSEAALAHAVTIANDHQADITVVSVLNTTGVLHAFFHNKEEININLQKSLDGKRTSLESWVKKIEPTLNFKVECFAGIGFIEIVQSVIKNQFDLVVKCADDVVWLDRLFGSDDMHLLRKCPCPVLMLKPGQNNVFQNILATVDVIDDSNGLDENRVQDQLNKKVLEYSAIFSIPGLNVLRIGCVWEAYAEDFLRYGAFSHMSEENIDLYTEQARRECSDNLQLLVKEMNTLVGTNTVDYLHPKVHLVKGRPSEEIPKMVKKYDVDLIVMGTVARTGIPGFIIGNTAESILELVQCSVLAIKPDGFKSPVEVVQARLI